MIYSCFFVLFGIYIGQEYTVPNMKLLSLGFLQYLHDKYNEHQKLTDNKNNDNNDNNILNYNIIKIILNKFTKSTN